MNHGSSSATPPQTMLTASEQLEAFWQLMEDVSDYAIFLFDPERKVVLWNRGAEQLEGYAASEILGQSADIIFTPEDRQEKAPDQEVATARREGRAADERWHMRKDGSRFWGSGVVNVLRAEDGSLRWYIKILRDLTERHEAQERMQAAQARTEAILESIRDAFYAVDKEWRLTYVNRQAERLWKQTRETLQGRVLWELFPGYETTTGYQMHLKAMQERQPVQFETYSQHLQIWVDVNIYPSAAGLTVYFRDITERKQAEAMRMALEQETTLLAERNRMAQELHDTLAQTLTGIKMQLDAAEDAFPQAETKRYIQRAREIALESLQETRRVVRALRTTALEGASLVAALQKMVEQTTQGTSIRGHWETHGAAYTLPGFIESELYRIAQESLTNALRHANAQEVTLRVDYAPEMLRLSIHDDGHGFHPHARPDGFGLVGMQERAGRIGADLTIESHPDDGTTIRILLPTTPFPKIGELSGE